MAKSVSHRLIAALMVIVETSPQEINQLIAALAVQIERGKLDGAATKGSLTQLLTKLNSRLRANRPKEDRLKEEKRARGADSNQSSNPSNPTKVAA